MQNRHVVPNNISEDYSRALSRLKETLKACDRVYPPAAVSLALKPLIQESLVIQEVNQWCTVMEGFIREGGKPARTKDLFRYYLSLLGLHIDASFIEAIKDGDVVEILRTDATRMFFNPELFDYSSYSPEEMFTIPCPQLYRRDSLISEKLYIDGYRMVTGEIPGSFTPDVPPHVVTETLSERRYSSEMTIKMMAPVRMGRDVVAVAALEKFRLLLS